MRAIPVQDRLFRGNIYRSIDIASTGMTAQRKRLDAISANLANAQVTNADGQGNPYLRRHVQMTPSTTTTFQSVLRESSVRLKTTGEGHIPVMESRRRVTEIPPFVESGEVELPNERKNVMYMPSHPDADESGYVVFPDVNIVEEMTDLVLATRSFEANVTVMNAAKQMIMKSLEI